eukprot:scaffold10173_cov119-Isochrysis_galbana.AAC.3
MHIPIYGTTIICQLPEDHLRQACVRQYDSKQHTPARRKAQSSTKSPRTSQQRGLDGGSSLPPTARPSTAASPVVTWRWCPSFPFSAAAGAISPFAPTPALNNGSSWSGESHRCAAAAVSRLRAAHTLKVKWAPMRCDAPHPTAAAG